MSDFLQSVMDNSRRERPQDERLAKLVSMKRQRAELTKAIKTLSAQLLDKVCEECGTPFRSQRVSARHCSMMCNARASVKHRKGRNQGNEIDYALIERHLASIAAAGLLSDRGLAIARHVVSGEAQGLAAERYEVSRQRVSQIVQRAMKAALMCERISQASQSEVAQ